RVQRSEVVFIDRKNRFSDAQVRSTETVAIVQSGVEIMSKQHCVGLEVVNPPCGRFHNRVFIEIREKCQSSGHASDLPPLISLSVEQELLDHRGNGVSECDR